MGFSSLAYSGVKPRPPMLTGSCLEIIAKHRLGESESSNEVVDFEAISPRY
ncbi:hypothetical protein Cycma_4011 [Cyclobacterium marinum DSM 745]|uniref:Uncharacterized protein n=1 Tax=Cyclobacterium marinum (strain ATCC 25205 / DSM 745 / LMG 13164 / NCIMB 1802) TaxID=880070 RepID=G0J787_CYCMS|nr:hypothetical protein Cycma_4011 [Cyclobacterium marinum DSM 745]